MLILPVLSNMFQFPSTSGDGSKQDVPDRWERAKSGKGCASCDNLSLDHDLRTKQKRADYSKQHLLVPKNVTRILMWSVFYQSLIGLDGFSWRGSKSSILQWHLSSVSACVCSSSDGSEFWGLCCEDGNMNRNWRVVPTTLDKSLKKWVPDCGSRRRGSQSR